MKYSRLYSWYVQVYTVGVKYGLMVHDRGLYIPFYIIPNRTSYGLKTYISSYIYINLNNIFKVALRDYIYIEIVTSLFS